MIIFKFTLKRNDNIETHYVRHSTQEEARLALAQHLGIDEAIIRFNPKNIPFKLRSKILNNEEGYTMTLDYKNQVNRTTTKFKTDDIVRKEFIKPLRESIKDSLKSKIQGLYNEEETILSQYYSDRVIAVNEIRKEMTNHSLNEEPFNSNITLEDALNTYSYTLVNTNALRNNN